MSDEPDVLELDPVIEAMHKLLGGRPPELQGPILADLLATWLAGHFAGEDRRATERMREEMLARVMAGNSGWDVVFPTNSFIQPMRELDLLQPLDQERKYLLLVVERDHDGVFDRFHVSLRAPARSTS